MSTSHSLDILTRLDTVVPPDLAALAERWTAARVPAPARPSASVILCRDAGTDSAGEPSKNGLEVYLLHRHARMAFAASAAVFPGGGMEAVDRATGDPRLACAIRETREETGIQLAEQALAPWAHWITPEVPPIRYDTYFYLAALPAGQVAADTSSETESAEWTRPAAAIDAWRAGSLILLPPTLSILLELADLPSVASAIDLARDRLIEPVLPGIVRGSGGWVFSYPKRSHGDAGD